MQTIVLGELFPVWSEYLAVSLADSLRDRTGLGYEAAACNLGDLIWHKNHPFVYAVHAAYAGHHPLALSPDDIWLCITGAFGMHVNLHAESLRDRLFAHQGRPTIQVRRDEFIPGVPYNDWSGVFAEFADKLAELNGEIAQLVVADFSTTAKVERGVSQIVLMSAMQPYVRYELLTLCGIPQITLLGTPEDWKSVRERASRLAQYDLEDWTAALLPILNEFVEASEGRANPDFWRSLYKLVDGSGGPYVSGWINTLFPYILTNSSGYGPSSEVMHNPFLSTWSAPAEPGKYGPVASQFPWALSRVAFEWTFQVGSQKMEFAGGFVGVSQNPDTLALRPAIGWAVRRSADPPISKRHRAIDRGIAPETLA